MFSQAIKPAFDVQQTKVTETNKQLTEVIKCTFIDSLLKINLITLNLKLMSLEIHQPANRTQQTAYIKSM